MSLLQVTPEIRPSRMVGKGKKDLVYHATTGRWAIGTASLGQLSRLHEKIDAAERAYNDRIVTQEDIDTFLRDENNNVRNRVFFNFNMFRTLIEQYRGTMIQTNFNASVQPVTRRTSTRKQVALSKQLLMHSIAGTSNRMKEAVQSRYEVGETLLESVGMFDNSYQDRHLKAVNHLLQRQIAINDMEGFKSDDAFRFATSGLLVSLMQVEGSFVRETRVHPRNFFFDPETENYDFSDSEFLGVFPLMSLGQIAENYKVGDDELRYVDDMLRLNANMGWAGVQGRGFGTTQLRVHCVNFRDIAYAEFGYINGPGGVPTLIRVGEDEEGRPPKFTRNDLIEPPKNADNDELFNGGRVAGRQYECTREVHMVPWEYMVTASPFGDRQRPDNVGDLVLKHGLCELQEYNPFDPKRSRMNIKAQAFCISDGEIITPVQAAIDPSRFMMRVLSGLENQINMSGAKGGWVDMDMVDPKYKLSDIQNIRKNGGTIPLATNMRGGANAIGSYDDTPGQGTYAVMQVVGAAENIIRTVLGQHEPMTGGKPQKNQAVGTTELLVQRGALGQEPFYDGYTNWRLQICRHYATAGKEWYMEHVDSLYDLIDVEDYMPLLLSEDVELERYNGKIDRDNPGEVKRQQANDWLNFLLQLGVLPQKLYYDLYDNADMGEVAAALKQYSAQLEMAEAQQAKEDAKQQMMQGLAAMKQQNDEKIREAEGQKAEAATSLAKIAAQGETNIAKEKAKAEFSPKPTATKA